MNISVFCLSFSASLSKVFNDFVPFNHQVHLTFFTSLPHNATPHLCAVKMHE